MFFIGLLVWPCWKVSAAIAHLISIGEYAVKLWREMDAEDDLKERRKKHCEWC